MDINRLLIRNWNCEIYGFDLQRDSVDSFKTYVDITLKENGELKILRFLDLSQMEVESRYSDDENRLQITDCTDDGMEFVKFRVSGSISGIGNFDFWAQDVIEIST